METAIRIGNTEEAIEKAREVVIEILQAGRSDQVTEKALDTLNEICKIENVTIQHCTFGDLASPDKFTSKESEAP